VGGYLRPVALPDALEVLAAGLREGRPWTVVAGATDYYPARVGRVTDDRILDISDLGDTPGIRATPEGWWIPARATWTDLVEAQLPAVFDGFKRAARTVGGLQVQNRGTIVGNLCNASPAADGIPNLVALDALAELASVRGVRRVPVDQFVTGNRATVRGADELVTGIRIRAPAAGPGGSARSTFLKLGNRAYLVISIAMVAGVLVRDAGGRVAAARIAVGACSPVARRLLALEAAVVGAAAVPGLGGLLRPEHLAPLAPIDDVRGSAGYRLQAAGVLVRRVLEELVA
jgi:CO/xanthine dehydrogenase FAD-binding subunit